MSTCTYRFNRIKCIVFMAVWLLTSISAQGQQSSRVLIAAASDLKYALDSIISVFKNVNREARVDVTFGSSGKLYEQISNGAPFDLFFSADIDYPSKLKKKGFIVAQIQTYGIGRIVLWSKKIDLTSPDLNVLLKKSIVKVAIANPAHAPYGRRAEEALKKSGIYEQIKDKLVYGENISQTAQFVTTGAADVGIVALSLALSPTMKNMKGFYYVIPDSLHSPLTQAFVMLKHAQKNSVALRFKDFMLAKDAREILSYFGFGKINSIKK